MMDRLLLLIQAVLWVTDVAHAQTPSIFSTSASSGTGWPAFPTATYTGQALLVGTCDIAQYTVLHFPDGGTLEVPLIGCSDDRPECCPGIVNSPPPASTGSATGSGSTTSVTGTTPSLTPTGVVSALSQNPLTVCPSDMVDLDPVCCPIGYQQYGQSIIGNLPCVSTLTSTVISAPSSVLASISSAVASSLAAGTTSSTTSTPTVNVVINQVFALGLPCADDDDGSSSSLSTGAKAGIGAGVSVAGLLCILLFAWCIYRHRKHKKEKEQARLSSQPMAIDPKHISTSTATTMMPGSPPSNQGAYFPQQQHPMQGYPQPGMYPMPGYVQPHHFPPTFGYVQPGHESIQPHYGYPQHGMYPGGYDGYGGYPTSASPPPPFHTGPERKPVEVDGGIVAPEPRHGPSGVVELSGSEAGTTTGDGSVRQSGNWGSSTNRS